MAQFEKRQKISKILYTRTSVVVLIIIIVFLGFSVFSVFQKRNEALSNAQSAERELKTLTDREVQTNQEIAKLSTDAGVEEAIRNKYRATKDGEGLVVVVTKDSQPNIEENKTVNQKSFWQQILGFFGI